MTSFSDQDRSPAEIEREVEDARATLRATLDEIRGRMSPRQMLDQALDYAQASGGAEFTRNLGRQVRDNPLPVALIGAGIGWLLVADRNGRRAPLPAHAHASTDEGPGLGERVREAASSAYRGVRERAESAYEGTSSVYGSVSDTTSGIAHGVGETVHHLGERASRLVGGTRERVAGLGSSASAYADEVGRMQRDITAGVARLIDEQPLVLGAVGLALGAAIAAVLPATTAERRAFGEASDRLRGRAGDVAREGYQQVRQSASEVVSEVREAATAPRGDDRSGGEERSDRPATPPTRPATATPANPPEPALAKSPLDRPSGNPRGSTV